MAGPLHTRSHKRLIVGQIRPLYGCSPCCLIVWPIGYSPVLWRLAL